MARRKSTQETWHRLLEWDRGSPNAERLAAAILPFYGFEKIDPQAPLGGRDGRKDIICFKKDKKFVAAAYFPRGQKNLIDILDKFNSDMEGVTINKAEGFIFITNQELRLSERETLKSLCKDEFELLHLEKLTTLLNQPKCFALRLEFLDIEMEKEEQLSYFQDYAEGYSGAMRILADTVGFVKNQYKEKKEIKTVDAELVPVSSRGLFGSLGSTSVYAQGTIEKLHKCEKCKFGFLVRVTNPMLILGPIGSMENCVKCPECGNVDTVSFF
jgi:hypothetical protein